MSHYHAVHVIGAVACKHQVVISVWIGACGRYVKPVDSVGGWEGVKKKQVGMHRSAHCAAFCGSSVHMRSENTVKAWFLYVRLSNKSIVQIGRRFLICVRSLENVVFCARIMHARYRADERRLVELDLRSKAFRLRRREFESHPVLLYHCGCVPSSYPKSLLPLPDKVSYPIIFVAVHWEFTQRSTLEVKQVLFLLCFDHSDAHVLA